MDQEEPKARKWPFHVDVVTLVCPLQSDPWNLGSGRAKRKLKCPLCVGMPVRFALERLSALRWNVHLFLLHGKPGRIVSDNGPEFRALKLDIHSFIQPGKPWQNGLVESFHGKLRDEVLNLELFTTGKEVQFHLDEYAEHYNNHRPHLGLGASPPLSSRMVSRPTYQRRKSYNSKVDRNWGLGRTCTDTCWMERCGMQQSGSKSPTAKDQNEHPLQIVEWQKTGTDQAPLSISSTTPEI